MAKVKFIVKDQSGTPLQGVKVTLKQIIENTINITMNPLSRFNNIEGNVTVSYDATKGNLAGLGGPVVSFSEEFTPDGLLKKLDPNDEERIEISDINSYGNLIRIYYTDSKSDERIEVADITATGVFIHINDL